MSVGANRRSVPNDNQPDMANKMSYAQMQSGVQALAERAPGHLLSSVAIDRDAANVFVRLGGLRHCDAQHAIPERGRGVVLLDIIQWYSAFKAAVVALAETASLVFRLRSLLA